MGLKVNMAQGWDFKNSIKTKLASSRTKGFVPKAMMLIISCFRFLRALSLNPFKAVNILGKLEQFFRDFVLFRKQCKILDVNMPIYISPVFDDKNAQAGSIQGHYFYVDLFVARKIYERKPRIHIDIGSRIDGFVAHVASFRQIIVMDIRPLEAKISNIIFAQGDIMNLDDRWKGSCDSLSCLHALEHFGLGRYGDNINPIGHINALENMRIMLQDGGILYLAAPIGQVRIEFNNQRVFDLSYLLSLIRRYFEIIDFHLIDDCGNFHESISLKEGELRQNFGCWYGCAIVEARKAF